MLNLYNSLTKKIEDFKPIEDKKVGFYSCGMTVYDYAHIGHGRKYTIDDILRRTLLYLGYEVKFVQNVTDVGHLTSDADEGGDKLEKGAKKAGKSVWDVAEFFTNHFYDSMQKLNILPPDVVCRATEHIDEQISLVKKLLEKGYAYETEEAIYFEISKFSDYGKMFGQSLEEKLIAVRGEVQQDTSKKNPADFALWFKTVGRFSDHTMRWDSPWGEGFPGWHIECSAMSMKYLGEQFDIHTGGIDHIPIHHPNEIAQSEAATGKSPFVKYWLHTAFLTVDGTKMSKSLNNFYTIDDVEEKGFDPMSLRYFYLLTHYRKTQNFTWEALESAQNALTKLYMYTREWNLNTDASATINEIYKNKFIESLSDDLNTAQALAVVWEMIKDDAVDIRQKLATLLDFDKVLGFNIGNRINTEEKISSKAKELVEEREKLRKEKKYDEADKIRDMLMEMGYEIRDK